MRFISNLEIFNIENLKFKIIFYNLEIKNVFIFLVSKKQFWWSSWRTLKKVLIDIKHHLFRDKKYTKITPNKCFRKNKM